MSGTTTEHPVRAPHRAGPMPRRVALMTTCMADLADPGPALATRQVLTRMGFDVEVPPQACCGQPAMNSGFPREARKVLASLVDAFDGYDAVVVPAGSCAAMVVHHGERLLGSDVVTRPGFDRLWEFSQFVVAYGEGLPLHLDATVTYHDGCHMTRFLGERTTPRELLGRIDGLELVEMAASDTCCGFGGTFSAKFPELSVAMADVKLAHAVASDPAVTGEEAERRRPHYLVSADPGCLLHLQTRADRLGTPVRTRHIAELVLEALGPADAAAPRMQEER